MRFTIGRIEGEDPLARSGGLARVLEIAEEEIGPIPEWASAASPVRTIPEVPDDGIPF